MGEAGSYRRQWEISNLIMENPHGTTLKQIADHFGVSVRTIRRDMEAIQSMAGPFHTDVKEHGEKYYYKKDMYLSKDLTLARDELLAFYVGKDLLKPLQGTYLWEAAQSGCEKIKKFLRPGVIDYADHVSTFFYRFEAGKSNYKNKGRMIDEVLKAMEDSKVIEVTYRSIASSAAKDKASKEKGTPDKKTYQIHPYSFVYYHNFIYLIGYACEYQEIRLWKMNRFLKVTVLNNFEFERPKKFNLEKFMKNKFCPFMSKKDPMIAKLIFSASAAPSILEQELSNIKGVKELEDGSLEVEIILDDEKPSIQWLLGFGKNVQVVSPKELRKAVKEEALRIVEIYQ